MQGLAGSCPYNRANHPTQLNHAAGGLSAWLPHFRLTVALDLNAYDIVACASTDYVVPRSIGSEFVCLYEDLHPQRFSCCPGRLMWLQV